MIIIGIKYILLNKQAFFSVLTVNVEFGKLTINRRKLADLIFNIAFKLVPVFAVTPLTLVWPSAIVM